MMGRSLNNSLGLGESMTCRRGFHLAPSKNNPLTYTPSSGFSVRESTVNLSMKLKVNDSLSIAIIFLRAKFCSVAVIND